MYSFRNHSISHNTESSDATQHSTWYTEQGYGVSVHTGFPNPGIDATTPHLDLNRLLIAHSTGTYLMRIAGNDWQHLGIFDGDIAIVDRVVHVQTQDTVIWCHGGDFSISHRNRIPPDAVVWGVVTGIIHQLRRPTGQGERS